MKNNIKNHAVSFIGVIIFVLLLSAQVSASGLDPVLSRYIKGEHSAMLTEVIKLAEDGNPEAQFALAMSYEHGRSVSINPVMAMIWYQRAADTYTEMGATVASRFSHEAIVRLQRQHKDLQL